MSEIYCDNAATSFPKPPEVEAAILHYARNLGASAGRGAYPRAMETGRLIEDTRRLLTQFFNATDPNRFIFTLNASDALNLAIKGLDWKAGDVAVVSAMEHNSVLRPLHALKERLGIQVVKVPARPDGWVNPADFEKAITPRTKLVALLHASNVSGTIQPIAEVGAIAKRHGIPFLVDAAQTAGALPIDIQAMNIDLLAFPGHKALLGPLGTGALYIREGLDLMSLREGGTGSRSELDVQPDFLPDKYEPGSHNALGLAGLKAGLEFLIKEGVPSVRLHEVELTRVFLEGLQNVGGLTAYGPARAEDRVAVVPVRMEGFTPQQLSEKLFKSAGLMTRSGLHCAPGAHQTLGTYPEGATRFSFGAFTTPQEVDQAVQSILYAARSTVRGNALVGNATSLQNVIH